MSITQDSNGVFTVSGSYASGTVNAISTNSITSNEPILAQYDDRKIKITFFDNLGVEIKTEYLSIIDINEATGIMTVNPDLETVGFATATYEVFWKLDDLDSAAASTGDIRVTRGIYTIYDDILVEGLLGNSYDLIFNNCIFKVLNGGIFYSGGLQYTNANGEKTLVRRHLIEFLGNSSYGSDNYRINGRSIANDGGTLILYNCDLFVNTTSRSDIDFRELSNIYLTEVLISGHISSYHHLDSTNMHLDRLKVFNSTSLELLRTPIVCKSLKSIECFYGLSIYPFQTGRDNLVVIEDLESIETNLTFKRNRGNLVLVDPILNFNEITTNGSSKILFCYSESRRFLDNFLQPLSNLIVDYFGAPTVIQSYDYNPSTQTLELTFSEDTDFILLHGKSQIYVSEGGVKDGGVTLDIGSTSGQTITINDVLNNPLSSMASPQMRTFERHTSNSDGVISSVCIAYAKLTGSTIEYYGSSSFKTSHNSEDYGGDIAPLRKSFQSQVLNNDVSAQSQLTLVRDEILLALTDGFAGIPATDLSGLESKIDLIPTTCPNVDLSGLEAKVDAIPTTCPDVSVDLSSLESKIDNLNITIPSVDLSGINTKLDAIQAELPINLTGTTITVDLDEVNEKLDTIVSASSGSSSSYYSSSSSSSKFL